MTEVELQAQVVALARQLGVLIGVTPDSRRAFSGEPDLRLCGKRGVIWAELKNQGGELNPAQTRWKWALLASGQAWRLWYPTDLATGQIERELGRIM